MDIFEVFMRGVVWVSVRLGMLVGMGIQQLYLFIFRVTAVRPVKETRLQKSEAEENRRIAGCGEVVTGFATHLGYIARECMSRDEIEEKIDNGISPEDLKAEILKRILEHPGITLGVHWGGDFPVKLPVSWRDKHVYIVGRSGSGKTNLIKYMIAQDLALGNGIGVLAPELELLTEGILPYIPKHRIDDVVFINPADTKNPVAFNPLHLEEWEDIDRKRDDMATIFKRLLGDTNTPRMDAILSRSFHALLERPGSTLLDIERLINPYDDSFRKEIIRTSRDERTINFFKVIYPSFRQDAFLPIYHRIDHLLSSKYVRALLCQPGRSFNFREAMDSGKILLFNLSDGILGEETSQLLGQFIIAKIQMAVMSRVDTPSAKRPPFYLYLDEFQTFTGKAEDSYAKTLSRGRKYNFGLILAHQQTGQISNGLLREILGNVSTLLTFSVSAEDARTLSQQYIFESENIPPQEFLSLKTGEAFGKIDKTVFKLRVPLADQHPDFQRAKEVIDRSRQNFADGGNGAGGTGRQPPPPRRPLPPAEPSDPAKVF